MPTSQLVLVICSVLFVQTCHGAMSRKVCTKPPARPPGVPPRDFPTVPDVFETQISMYSVLNQTTIDMFEIFDSPNGRAILTQTEATGPGKNITLTGYEIFNFYSNQKVELVMLPDQTHVCEASDLDNTGTDSFIFGDKVNSKTGFSAKTAFYIDQKYPPQYQGRTTLRDTKVNVDWWKDCVYISSMDATMNVEWYFTADKQWTSALGYPVPILLHVYGKIKPDTAEERNVENYYAFSNFLDFLTDNSKSFFQIPQGTVCPFLKSYRNDKFDKSPHTLPTIASSGYFSFNAELVQKLTADSAALITYVQEAYDSVLKLSRYDLNPGGLIDTFFTDGANEPFKEIHDFQAGLAYIIDKVRGNCTVGPLTAAPDFDVKGVDANHVRMKTVNEFFGLTRTSGSSMNWTYTGTRIVRDIKADIYVAERVDYPPGTGFNATWEIAFMNIEEMDLVPADTELEFQEPMRIWVKIPAIDRTITYNIFSFNEEQPDLDRYDISYCFTDDQKQKISFVLPGDQLSVVENNRREFHYFIMLALVGSLDLTPTRISNIQFEATADKNILVSFMLLDPPSMKGSTGNTQVMMPSDQAMQLLQSAIDNGNFVVEAGTTSTFNSMKPMIGSLVIGYEIRNITILKNLTLVQTETVTNTVVKLDQGAAAGIGIGLLIAGILIGVLIIFIVNKVKGVPLPNLNMSFAPKTFEEQK